jgi:hypothetical protein
MVEESARRVMRSSVPPRSGVRYRSCYFVITAIRGIRCALRCSAILADMVSAFGPGWA